MSLKLSKFTKLFHGEKLTRFLRISRGNQNFIFPILLYEEFLPSALVYGTLAPVLIYSSVMKFIVNPYVENKNMEEILRKRKQNKEKLIESRKEALAVRKLLKQTYDKVFKLELESRGLVIENALYGKSSLVQISAVSNQLPSNGEVIDVKLPLQCLVRFSQLIQPAASKVRSSHSLNYILNIEPNRLIFLDFMIPVWAKIKSCTSNTLCGIMYMK